MYLFLTFNNGSQIVKLEKSVQFLDELSEIDWSSRASSSGSIVCVSSLLVFFSFGSYKTHAIQVL